MTKKEQLLYDAKLKKLFEGVSKSNQLIILERYSKRTRLANNLEIKKETTDFANKLTRSA
jgi:hypothetical protein